MRRAELKDAQFERLDLTKPERDRKHRKKKLDRRTDIVEEAKRVRRRLRFEKALGYCNEILNIGLSAWDELWEQYPEYRAEIQSKTKSIVDVFQKRAERQQG